MNRYYFGCNARWATVREGLQLVIMGGLLGLSALIMAFMPSELGDTIRMALVFIGGAQFGLAFGAWGVALSRSKVNDIIGTDVWGPTK